MKKRPVDNYKIARSNLLLMLVLTTINIALMYFESDTYLLFSATVPMFFAVLGFAAELYPCLIVVGIILMLYLFCWIFSKRHYAWMIVAAVLFAIDTICMIFIYLGAFDASMVLDILIHAWVMYYLILGIVSGAKLKKEVGSDFKESVKTVKNAEEVEITINESPLRMAEDVKARIFLEENVLGRQVVYRRVKRTNELVIDGYVYDEYEALVETEHWLRADINGHIIEAGFDGKGFSYIKLDGEVIKRKLRLA